MKNNADVLYASVKNALEEKNISEQTKKLIFDSVKLMEESVFPTFDRMSFAGVSSDDEKNNSLTLNINCHVRDVSGISIIKMVVLGDELRITIDPEQYFEFIFSDTKRVVKFKYDNDIICIEGSKDHMINDYKTNYYIKNNGGYSRVKLSVYLNAWEIIPHLDENRAHHFDLDKYEHDFCSVLLSNSNYEIPCVKFDNICIDIDDLENSLDSFIGLGILYRNYKREKEIDIYNPVTVSPTMTK